jgi:hypothetical protein
MTRVECHQIVLDSTPGRFEGEEDWTPYFYEFYLNGDPGEYEEPEECQDCECQDCMDCGAMDNPVSVYDVEPEDIAIFPELAGVKQVRLWQTDSGFICTECIDK